VAYLRNLEGDLHMLTIVVYTKATNVFGTCYFRNNHLYAVKLQPCSETAPFMNCTVFCSCREPAKHLPFPVNWPLIVTVSRTEQKFALILVRAV